MTAFALKLAACISMLIDHAAFAFEPQLNAISPWLYIACRMVGRLAFPLFALGIAEGAVKTSSPRKYLVRVALFTLIAQIPYSLMLALRADPGSVMTVFVFGKSIALYKGLSVMATLLFGLVACLGVKMNKPLYTALALAAAYLIDSAIGMDYGFLGVVFVFALYLSRASRAGLVLTLVLFAACFYFRPLIDFCYGIVRGRAAVTKGILLFAAMALSAVPAALYNGKKGPNTKLLFYCFYPAHMLVIWAASCIINK